MRSLFFSVSEVLEEDVDEVEEEDEADDELFAEGEIIVTLGGAWPCCCCCCWVELKKLMKPGVFIRVV